jgi:hypothetical protein
MSTGYSDHYLTKIPGASVVADIYIELTPELENSQVIHVPRTVNYFTYSSGYYLVNSKYKDVTLKGTSITVNDLVYEPNIEGHRLFLRNGLYKSNQAVRNKIYYRDVKIPEGKTEPDKI